MRSGKQLRVRCSRTDSGGFGSNTKHASSANITKAIFPHYRNVTVHIDRGPGVNTPKMRSPILSELSNVASNVPPAS